MNKAVKFDFFQSIVSKKLGVLNHISFNPEEPIVVVGDSRGHVHSMKLSPNLRKRTKESQLAYVNQDIKEFEQLERKKLEQLLNQLIEPIKKSTNIENQNS